MNLPDVEYKGLTKQWGRDVKAYSCGGFPYHCGLGIEDIPTAEEILAIHAYDGLAASQRFEDWCSEYGLDPDSIAQRKIWEQSRENLLKLINTYGLEQVTKWSKVEL